MAQVGAGELGGAVGEGAQVDRVADEFEFGDLGAQQGEAGAAGLGAEDAAAAGGEVAEDGAEVVVGQQDADGGDGFEQADDGVFGGVAQGEGGGVLEGRVGGVDGVGLAVGEGDPDVDEGVSGGDALGELGADALLDGGDEVFGDGAADDVFLELEARAGREGLDLQVADGVLAVAAGLFDEATVAGGGGAEGLAQGDLGFDGVDVDAVAGAEPVEDDLGVGLAGAPEDELVGVGILFEA